jgi:carbonic anhydrase
VPHAVARLFGNEVYPGQIILDSAGNRVASSGDDLSSHRGRGRAIDALRSITVAQHLFGIENIVVVHHSQCGATTFQPTASSMRIGTNTARTSRRFTIAGASASRLRDVAERDTA